MARITGGYPKKIPCRQCQAGFQAECHNSRWICEGALCFEAPDAKSSATLRLSPLSNGCASCLQLRAPGSMSSRLPTAQWQSLSHTFEDALGSCRRLGLAIFHMLFLLPWGDLNIRARVAQCHSQCCFVPRLMNSTVSGPSGCLIHPRILHRTIFSMWMARSGLEALCFDAPHA